MSTRRPAAPPLPPWHWEHAAKNCTKVLDFLVNTSVPAQCRYKLRVAIDYIKTGSAFITTPIDMLLYCPKCGLQHVDEPGESWNNPPHRSHLCAGCGHIWRPADVPTNGVAAIKTHGKDDSPAMSPLRHADRDNGAKRVIRTLAGMARPDEQDDVDEEIKNEKQYQLAAAYVVAQQKASTRFIQRHLQCGYIRADRILERMMREGIVTEPDHVGNRKVLRKQL